MLRLPTEQEVKEFDVATLVAVANRMGISRARWDYPDQLRGIMLEKVRQDGQKA